MFFNTSCLMCIVLYEEEVPRTDGGGGGEWL